MERLLGSAWWVHGSGTVDGWDLANRFIVGTLCQYQKGHVRLLHIPWWWFPNWYYVNQKLLGDGKVSRGHHSCYLVGGRTVDPTSSTPWWQTFAGNNSAWFVVRFGLRHVRRDDLRSSWFLAVNCFLVKRYIGIGMKHYPNVWIKKTYALISHTKENNFNQYTKTNLWPYTWNQNKIQNNLFLYSSIWHYFTPFGENGTKKLPPQKRLQTEPISTNRQAERNLKCSRFHGGWGFNFIIPKTFFSERNLNLNLRCSGFKQS